MEKQFSLYELNVVSKKIGFYLTESGLGEREKENEQYLNIDNREIIPLTDPNSPKSKGETSLEKYQSYTSKFKIKNQHNIWVSSESKNMRSLQVEVNEEKAKIGKNQD